MSSRGTKNKIEDLRNHLFATLEALQDDDAPMEIERARAISHVAQTVINSAKVEVDYLKVVGDSMADMRGEGTNFIPSSINQKQLT